MLAKFKESLASLRSPSKLLMLVIVVAIFVGASAWVYMNYLKPKLNPNYVVNKEYVSGAVDVDQAYVYFYYTEWCPHCKTARVPWNELKDYIASKGGAINNVKVETIEIDCEKDAATADKNGITGYPTIVLESGDQKVTFDANVTLPALKEFLSTSLPVKSS